MKILKNVAKVLGLFFQPIEKNALFFVFMYILGIVTPYMELQHWEHNIYGNAWLEQCIIKINRKSGGWIVAPKHRQETHWGYVFNGCTLTADGNPAETSILLGRPWHHQPKTVFLNTRCEITIPAEGWCPHMNGLPSIFAEYNTMDADGHLLDLSHRISHYYRFNEQQDTIWCTAKNVLNAEEAAIYTAEAVMGGDDQWNPEQIFAPVEKPHGYVVIDDKRIAVNQYGCFERE